MENQKMMYDLKQPLLGKYNITGKLKTGGFAHVYLAEDVKNRGKKYAIKMIPHKNHKYATIEANLYNLIQEKKYTHGFVKLIESGKHNDSIFLVLELLGQDLEELSLRNKKLTVKTALMVGLQVLDRLQALHTMGYLHRDIKPDNLAIGLKQRSKIIYLIDFGLALKLGQSQNHDQVNKAIGTLGYMSVRAHEGLQQGKGDDLESLVYTMIYLMVGTLPWMNIKLRDAHDIHRIKILKERIRKELSGTGSVKVPKEIFDILDYVRHLKRGDTPDYLKMKFKLIEALKGIQQENDFNFDWCLRYFDRFPRQESSREKQQMKMKEHNQKLVEGQIYQVYRFMDKEDKRDKDVRKKSLSKEKRKRQRQQKEWKRLQEENAKKLKKEEKTSEKARQLEKEKKELEKFLLNDPSVKNEPVTKPKPNPKPREEPQKPESIPIKSSIRIPKEEVPIIKALKQQVQKPASIRRPITAKKTAQQIKLISRPQNVQKLRPDPWKNKWADQVKKVNEMSYEAPRIVINKTAKHKI